MIWGTIGEMAIGEFIDPFDTPVAPTETQLTSDVPHGWVRDHWDRDEWGTFILGAGIHYA